MSRDYIHVDDLADAHIRAMEKLTQGEPIICNLGTGNGFSVKEILKTAEKVTGKKVPHNVWRTPGWGCDRALCRSITGRRSFWGGKRNIRIRRRSSARRGTGSASIRGDTRSRKWSSLAHDSRRSVPNLQFANWRGHTQRAASRGALSLTSARSTILPGRRYEMPPGFFQRHRWAAVPSRSVRHWSARCRGSWCR